jgi:nicotinamidase/pyrazinamidase
MYDEKAALIVVDVQNDFADPKGSLHVAGGSEIVPLVNAEIERALAAGALVVYSQDWHPTTTPHFKKDGGIWPEHCIAGTWGAAFHPDLEVVPGAEIIRKGSDGEDGYSAFSVRDPLSGARSATRLQSVLAARGIERLTLAGLATDYCVKETALDGLRLGFAVEVLTGAVRAVDLQTGDGRRALDAIEAAGGRLL